MRRLVGTAMRSFVHGLLALLPLLVTAYLLLLLFRFVGRLIDDALLLLPPELRGIPLVVIGTQVAAALVLFAVVAVFGAVARTVFGRAAVGSVDRLFAGIPVLNSVYSATRQVVDIFTGRRDRFFSSPILVEYPSTGIWAVAFATGAVGPELSPEPEHEYITVFIPTTPNPTSGVLAMVSKERVKPLPMTVEAAMKLILTGGVVKEIGGGRARPVRDGLAVDPSV